MNFLHDFPFSIRIQMMKIIKFKIKVWLKLH
jgi:hypothetical protein